MSSIRNLSQPAPKGIVPSTKIQKLEAYSDTMATCALSREKEGRMNEAASYFLKAADILIIVCKDPNVDYPTWARLSEKASSYHKRVKVLLAMHRRQDDLQSSL